MVLVVSTPSQELARRLKDLKYAKLYGAADAKTEFALMLAKLRQNREITQVELAEKSGIDDSMILKWVNMADLYRVNGVGSEYSELLEKAGVDTVKELRNRNAENLLAKMKEINSQGKALVRQLPGLKRVQSWIENAKKLDPMVTY